MENAITPRDAQILQDAWNSVHETRQLIEEARTVMVSVGATFDPPRRPKPKPEKTQEAQQVID